MSQCRQIKTFSAANVVGCMTSTHLRSGVVGGFVGGLLFGAMMAFMGMLPMIAMLVGSESGAVGMVVHIALSVVFGLAFAIVVGSKIASYPSGVGYGAIYGVLLWVLGPLVFMPLALGMGVMLSLEGATAAIPSLVGHLVYGVILGLAFPALEKDKKASEKDVEPPEEIEGEEE